MSIKVTTLLSYLCGKDGKRIKGIKGCASDYEVMEKASLLPPGEYRLERPPVKIVIK